ncbi:MAG: ATP-dependent helicase HrpB [Silicimonas sp.]|nr:ATP-dependent helicase HrpB [Silicimonas sp.]
MTRLPVEDAIPDLLAALARDRLGVLQAPPGAGKTTRVPLAMLEAGLYEGRIVMLEPRRLATRAAAARMAETLGEPVGKTVGFRMRGEAKVSAATCIEVVTEGILTRMIQSDPTLDGIGAVIFDEFHERSLNADLGLALALEVRDTLRPDLILLAMSATLDAEPVADLMGAQVITSKGQSFPIETRWLDKPLGPKARWDTEMATLIRRALSETDGGILAFLPGEGEIRRVAQALGGISGTTVLPLYGALAFKAQQAALRPMQGRKLVLATAIAETSLTIPDIRVVVDGGRARRARFDSGSGMSRLVTERVTRAEADQRRGRAGRLAEGTCYRLWTKGEEGGLAPFPPAEIEAADLSDLALELAEWGADDLKFLTPPPEGALSNARALLVSLGALDKKARITAHGRALAKMPLHPRLAHMLATAGAAAAPLAALLADRDPLRGAGADLNLRLAAMKDGRREPALHRIFEEAKRLERRAPPTTITNAAAQAALAYPDRIGLRRPGDDPRWLLSGGKGVKMDPSDPLVGQRLLVVTDTDGHPTEATVRTALAIAESDLRNVLGDLIETVTFAQWSKRDGKVLALIEERLGAIALSSKRWDTAPDDTLAAAMLDGVRQLGLPHSDAAERFRARVALVRSAGHDLPDVTDTALMDSLEHWLLPHLGKTRNSGAWKAFDTLHALRAMLDWSQTQLLDREAPAHFETPLGRKIAIDYGAPDPEISVRLQEMFGTTRHPRVAGRPLRVTLLSPANRPLQTTMDVPGFWASSYQDVRKDMRGKYPKHAWPDDPTIAGPTLRPKRRT